MMDNNRHDFFQNDDILRYESPSSPTAFKIFTGDHHQEDERAEDCAGEGVDAGLIDRVLTQSIPSRASSLPQGSL